ncbi:MAG: aconitase family protein, partial [Aliihoeflea sp.]
MTQAQPKTLFAKVWDAHVIETDGDQDLLWIDRHFVHEGSFHAFGKLEESGRTVRHPELTFGVADHYVPSDHSAPPKDAEVANMIDLLTRNATTHGIDLFAMGDARQGIVHVAAPEQGLSLPGLTIVCGDSHTATHGAFGAFAFGIGASEVTHVLATQTLWQKRPKVMRITVDGVLDEMTGAKDLALYIISRIGTGGATGHVVEYDGRAIRALSMEGRMTLCNMTIEAGARAGMVAPDETTFIWLEGRPMAPKGPEREAARVCWEALRSDPDATFDKELRFDAADIGPMVTWGT